MHLSEGLNRPSVRIIRLSQLLGEPLHTYMAYSDSSDDSDLRT